MTKVRTDKGQGGFTSWQGPHFRMVMVAVACLVLLAGGTAGLALYRMARFGAELTQITAYDVPVTATATRIEEYRLEQAIAVEQALRHGREMQLDPAKRQSFEEAVSRFRRFSNAMGRELRAAGKLLAKLEADAATEQDRAELARIKVALDRTAAIQSAHETHALEVLADLRAGEMSIAQVAVHAVEKETQELDEDIGALLDGMRILTQVPERGYDA